MQTIPCHFSLGKRAATLFFTITLTACASSSTSTSFPLAIPQLIEFNSQQGDPYYGRFPLERAVAGLPPGDRLIAILKTNAGEIPCELDPHSAPLTVANFVGLARGLRPFQATSGGPWITEPFYQDIPWHRAVEGQLIQAGQRAEQTSAGFHIQDEITPGQVFDRAGTLAMANTGTPHSGSAQFFITMQSMSHLTGKHTIFGSCDGEHVVRELSRRIRKGQQAILHSIMIKRI